MMKKKTQSDRKTNSSHQIQNTNENHFCQNHMMKGETQSYRKTNSSHQIQNTMRNTFADKSIERMKIPGLKELLQPDDDKEDTEGDDDKF